MADNFFEIYRNASLGATQMNDGQETILTTNSNTSYVIKDMYVNGTSNLSGTYLELNGFNVGSINKNATGSLIIPPNSTLKIKTTDYPYSFQKKKVLGKDGNGRCHYHEEIYVTGDEDNKAITNGISSQGYFSNYASYALKINLNYDNSNNAHWYMEAHDNNSVQYLGHLAQTNTGNASQLQYQNYIAIGTGYKRNGDFISYQNSGSTWWQLNMDHFPAYAPTSGPQVASGVSYSPTSSYPRHFYTNDLVFWRTSSGYIGQLRAINLNNGQQHHFYMNSTTGSGYNFIAISHDPRDDKLYAWQGDSGIVLMSELPVTLTQMLAGSTSGNSVRDVQHNPNPSLNTSSTVRSRMAAGPNGGLQFSGSDNKLYFMDIDGNVTGGIDKTYEVNGNTQQKDYLDMEYSTATVSEAAAAGISAPTFGIQLLGVKSTT